MAIALRQTGEGLQITARISIHADTNKFVVFTKLSQLMEALSQTDCMNIFLVMPQSPTTPELHFATVTDERVEKEKFFT